MSTMTHAMSLRMQLMSLRTPRAAEQGAPPILGVSTLPRRLQSPQGWRPSEQGSLVLLLVPEDVGGREGEVLLADVAVVEPVQGGGFGRAPSLFLWGGCGGRQCKINPQTL